MDIALAILLLLLLYAWVGYPLMLALLAPRHPHAPTSPSDSKPTVTILLAAYREEKHIHARLENLLRAAAPAQDIQIRVGIDGDGDDTGAIATHLAQTEPKVHVHEFPARRGKVAVLKDLVAQSEGDILVFTDANTAFADGALAGLLAPFADARVGGVCGRLVFPPGREESVYWRWETRLKEKESAVDSCLGANGAIYAIRRNLFWKDIPQNTIIDDFVIGMKVREQGYRMLYEPAAVATEDLPEEEAEWGRRTRIGAGDFQSLRFCRRCLRPSYGRLAWMFWSHKVLRWFTPHMLLASLVGSWFVPSGWARCAPTGVVVAAAAAGYVVRRSHAHVLGPLRLCFHFLAMQAALFAGFLRFCRGDLKGYWTRTPRAAPPSS